MCVYICMYIYASRSFNRRFENVLERGKKLAGRFRVCFRRRSVAVDRKRNGPSIDHRGNVWERINVTLSSIGENLVSLNSVGRSGYGEI